VSHVGEHRFLCGEARGRPPDPWATTCPAPTSVREAFKDGKKMCGEALVSWREGGTACGRPPDVADVVSHIGALRFVSGKDRGRPPDVWATTCLAPTTVCEASKDGKKNQYTHMNKDMNRPIFATVNGKSLRPTYAVEPGVP
jgi:hypothetical protein